MVLVGIQLEKLGVSGSAVLLKACTAQCSFFKIGLPRGFSCGFAYRHMGIGRFCVFVLRIVGAGCDMPQTLSGSAFLVFVSLVSF